MRIAITGGICEGKSTLLNWLKEEGWGVCSSDDVARDLFAQPGINRELARIASLPEPLEPQALRAAILESNRVRRSVNRFLHPLIGERSRRAEATFFEVPLLIEACLQGSYDRVWVATCGVEEQHRRLMARYRDPVLVGDLLRTQLDSRARVAFADRIFRTNEPREAVRSSLHEATQELSQ